MDSTLVKTTFSEVLNNRKSIIKKTTKGFIIGFIRMLSVLSVLLLLAWGSKELFTTRIPYYIFIVLVVIVGLMLIPFFIQVKTMIKIFKMKIPTDYENREFYYNTKSYEDYPESYYGLILFRLDNTIDDWQFSDRVNNLNNDDLDKESPIY